MDQLSRRRFLASSAVAGASLALAGTSTLRAAGAADRKVSVAVMGLGRGMGHVQSLITLPGVEVSYVCDVDEHRLSGAVKAVEARQETPPKAVRDFRRILDDRSVDAITIAAPNFWHAPATILACAAGKHVYVEKPGSHNAREGELMVEAARKHQRLVQMGTQRRSQPGIIEGIEKARGGAIGKLRFARTCYKDARPSIGRGKEVPVPAWLDYDLWEGPVPHRPYLDNLVHYNWHWRWHWGGGELANNGIHDLDLVRWGLGVEFPRTVVTGGGRYRYDDDQETPDTTCAVFDFGDRGASWDGSSCHPRKVENPQSVTFYGDGGSLSIEGGGYVMHDLDGKQVEKKSGPYQDAFHFGNFVEAIRGGAKLTQPIEEGQKSTLLCHLGNIAFRSGRTIHCDPATGKIVGDEDAVRRFWGREYRDGWEPKV